MNKLMYDIAAIIVNYNSSKVTQECINSIIDNTATSIDLQVIVVDNCSETEEFVSLRHFCDSHPFKNLQLIRSKINTGFGGGNMIGVNLSNASYLAFINSDTLFLNDCLSILRSAIETDDTISMVGGQSYKDTGEPMIAFDHFTSIPKELFGRDFLETINPKKYPRRKSKYTDPLKVNYVQGSLMLVRALDFNNVGGFDTNLFLFYEESDLCKRLERIGKSSYLIPDAKYIHYHGASTPQNIAIKTELKISLLYVIRKHYGYFWHQILLNKLRVQFFFKSIFKPKYWSTFRVLMVGAPLSKSLKLKQKIVPLR